MVPVKRPEAVRLRLPCIVFLIIYELSYSRHMLFAASLSWVPTQLAECSLMVRSSEGKILHSSAGSFRAQKLMKGLTQLLLPGRGHPLRGVLGMRSSPLGPMQ